MARSWVGSDRGGQPTLMAAHVADMLPVDHRVWRILELVGRFDLSAFVAAYRSDGWGRPPFDPRVMVALLVYCRSKGLLSGRAVAAACHDDLGARLITGNRFPDRSTVDRFLDVHGAAIGGLLAQTLRLADAEGLIDVSVVAGDGTKIVANAAMGATVTEAELIEEIAVLRQRLDTAVAAGAAAGGPVPRQPALFAAPGDGAAGGGEVAPAGSARQVRTLQRLLRSRQATLAYLREHPNTDLTDWADRLERDQQRISDAGDRLTALRDHLQAKHQRRAEREAAGARIAGGKPVPVEEHLHVRRARDAVQQAITRAETTAAARPATARVNTTDPASQIMPGKHDGYDQRHNLQALATRNQLILAVTLHPSSNDKRALGALLIAARDNLDQAGITTPIGVALFDNGYASHANFTAEHPVEILLVAVEKEARQTQRLLDGTSTAARSWQDMTELLNQPEHRKLYRERGAIIEPVFAQLFATFDRAVNHRGVNAGTELHLWAVTHNLRKIARQTQRPPG
jgi:transposase